MPPRVGANMADNPAQYQSPPESIELAREMMREIKEAITRDADGQFPAKYADVGWDGIDLPPPEIAWQDMDMGQRYDLLLHVLDEWIGLEPSAVSGEPRDSKKLALEFVEQDARQAMPGFRAEAFDALTTQLEEFRDEFARLARTTGQTALAEKFGGFVGEAHWVIARLAEARPPAGLDAFGREDHGVKFEDTALRPLDRAAEGGKGQGQSGEQQWKRLPSPGEIAEDRGGPESPGPDRGHDRRNGR
jgi:hypothetical protein